MRLGKRDSEKIRDLFVSGVTLLSFSGQALESDCLVLIPSSAWHQEKTWTQIICQCYNCCKYSHSKCTTSKFSTHTQNLCDKSAGFQNRSGITLDILKIRLHETISMRTSHHIKFIDNFFKIQSYFSILINNSNFFFSLLEHLQKQIKFYARYLLHNLLILTILCKRLLFRSQVRKLILRKVSGFAKGHTEQA